MGAPVASYTVWFIEPVHPWLAGNTVTHYAFYGQCPSVAAVAREWTIGELVELIIIRLVRRWGRASPRTANKEWRHTA